MKTRSPTPLYVVDRTRQDRDDERTRAVLARAGLVLLAAALVGAILGVTL